MKQIVYKVGILHGLLPVLFDTIETEMDDIAHQGIFEDIVHFESKIPMYYVDSLPKEYLMFNKDTAMLSYVKDVF